MLNFVLATGNAHKAQEMSSLFDANIISIELALNKVQVEESGTTFTENSKLKAHAYYQSYQRPTVADDSGLVVEALPGELGVYSARFGGEGLKDDQRAKLLLDKMADKTGESRKAYFVCTLCFYLGPDEIYFFEGRLNGEIASEYRGKGGFGYDPVFVPEALEGNQTLAEVPDWKDQFSHRAVACHHAQRFFQERSLGRV